MRIHLALAHVITQASAPSLGIGRIKARDNPALYGTEREYSLRTPDDPFYKRFSAEASRCVGVRQSGELEGGLWRAGQVACLPLRPACLQCVTGHPHSTHHPPCDRPSVPCAGSRSAWTCLPVGPPTWTCPRWARCPSTQAASSTTTPDLPPTGMDPSSQRSCGAWGRRCGGRARSGVVAARPCLKPTARILC